MATWRRFVRLGKALQETMPSFHLRSIKVQHLGTKGACFACAFFGEGMDK
jgi:hypothetical protein